MSEYWADYREVGRYVREGNRQKSLAVFAESTNLAELHGLTLRRLSDVHYQLFNGEWLLNIIRQTSGYNAAAKNKEGHRGISIAVDSA